MLHGRGGFGRPVVSLVREGSGSYLQVTGEGVGLGMCARANTYTCVCGGGGESEDA
jgi:hypothetical protein